MSVDLSNPLALQPEHIAISKSTGIRIDWKDGARSELRLQFLRDHCPCAVCTGAHGTPSRAEQLAGQQQNPFQMYQAALRILSVEPVGNYAIKIAWSDGHSTGLYSWETLRLLSEKAKAAP